MWPVRCTYAELFPAYTDVFCLIKRNRKKISVEWNMGGRQAKVKVKMQFNMIMGKKRASYWRRELPRKCVCKCVCICLSVNVYETFCRTSRAVTSSIPTEAVTCANTLAPSSSSLLTNLTRSAVLRDTRGDEAPPIPKGGQDRAHFLIMFIWVVRYREGGINVFGADRVTFASSRLFFNGILAFDISARGECRMWPSNRIKN